MTTLADVLLGISRAIGDGVSGSAAIDQALMIKCTNQALDMMSIPDWDESTTVTDDTLRYALPAGVSQVRRVEIGTHTDGWKEHRWWREEDGYLMFYKNEPTDTDDTIRILYAKKHTTLTATTDTIDPAVPFSRLVAEAVLNCLTFRRFQVGTDEPRLDDLIKRYDQIVMIERNKHPMVVKYADTYATW